MKTAVRGNEFILRACAKYNIPKVVVTSSIKTVHNQKNKKGNTYGPSDFSDPKMGNAYTRSKTLAELKTWELQKELKLNVTTIHPGLILGKYIHSTFTPTSEVTKKMFQLPFYMANCLPYVHPDDVAEAHVRCLERPEISKNKRYLCVGGAPRYTEYTKILK